MKKHNIDGMTLYTYPVYPTDISIPKAIKILASFLAVIFLIELAFGGQQISMLVHASNGVVFAGLLAWS